MAYRCLGDEPGAESETDQERGQDPVEGVGQAGYQDYYRVQQQYHEHFPVMHTGTALSRQSSQTLPPSRIEVLH